MALFPRLGSDATAKKERALRHLTPQVEGNEVWLRSIRELYTKQPFFSVINVTIRNRVDA